MKTPKTLMERLTMTSVKASSVGRPADVRKYDEPGRANGVVNESIYPCRTLGRTDTREDLTNPTAHTDLGPAAIDTFEAIDVRSTLIQLEAKRQRTSSTASDQAMRRFELVDAHPLLQNMGVMHHRNRLIHVEAILLSFDVSRGESQQVMTSLVESALTNEPPGRLGSEECDHD